MLYGFNVSAKRSSAGPNADGTTYQLLQYALTDNKSRQRE
jgi:hypothetical protein